MSRKIWTSLFDKLKRTTPFSHEGLLHSPIGTFPYRQ
jgi:hypothetical protein